jgi:hypothetical protein
MIRLCRTVRGGLVALVLAGCAGQPTASESADATFMIYDDEAVPSIEGTANDTSRVERSGGHGYGSGN